MRTALLRFQPTPDTITPLHAMLAQLGLLSRMHTVILPILEIEMTRISPGETGTDAEDVLLYLYYGGTVYLGLRRFRDAEDMFACAISGMMPLAGFHSNRHQSRGIVAHWAAMHSVQGTSC